MTPARTDPLAGWRAQLTTAESVAARSSDVATPDTVMTLPLLPPLPAERAEVCAETVGAEPDPPQRAPTDQWPDQGAAGIPRRYPSSVAGLLRASQCRPVSWADQAARPSPRSWCRNCEYSRWWGNESGWRCWTCHRPDGRVLETVEEVGSLSVRRGQIFDCGSKDWPGWSAAWAAAKRLRQRDVGDQHHRPGAADDPEAWGTEDRDRAGRLRRSWHDVRAGIDAVRPCAREGAGAGVPSSGAG